MLRTIAANGVIAGLIMAASVPAVRAQTEYPKRVVTLVTHSSPGGGSDVFLREMTPHLSAILHATLIVENLSGGSGARAMAALAKARPDGGTFYATTPTFIFTSLMSRPAASYRDLEPLVNIFYDPEVLYTAADSRFNTLADVIDHARRGGGRWGAANPASLERHTLERLKQKTGVAAAIATFEGGGDMQLNVLNHTLDMGIGELQEIVGQLEARTVRVLAVVGDERLPQYPEVETVKEQGIDLSVRKFRGLAAPKGTPPDVIAAWEAAIPRLLDDPAYKRIYLANGLQSGFMPHAAYVAFISEFAAQTAAFLESSGNTIPQSLDEASDGEGLPTFYTFLLAGLSLILVVQSVRSRSVAGWWHRLPGFTRHALQRGRAGIDGGGGTPAAGRGKSRLPLVRWRVAGMLAIGILYVSIVPWLGYMLSLAGLIAATTYYQGGAFNRRVAIVAACGAVFFWLLFVVLLRIPQPAGLWPSLL